MQFQTNPTQLASLISRRMQIAFVAGLLLGVFLGWAFSGVVSAVMRLGLLAVLLIPLIIALIFWWKVRQAPKVNGTTIVTWGNTGLPPTNNDPFGSADMTRPHRGEDIIDLDELRRERKP